MPLGWGHFISTQCNCVEAPNPSTSRRSWEKDSCRPIVLQFGSLDASNRPREAGTHGVAVAMDALEFQADPVVPHPSIIPQQQSSFAVVSHLHVDVPIIVEVADGEAAGRKRLRKNRGQLGTDVVQRAGILMKQQKWLFVFHTGRSDFNHIIRMTVSQREVHGTVIIKIKKLQAPTTQQASGLRDGVLVSDVRECLVFIVLIERERTFPGRRWRQRGLPSLAGAGRQRQRPCQNAPARCH